MAVDESSSDEEVVIEEVPKEIAQSTKEASKSAELCWYCSGTFDAACPFCGELPEDDGPVSEVLLGQDGFVACRKEKVPRAEDSPQEYAITLMRQAEEAMASGNSQKAEDLCDRVFQNMSMHFQMCEENRAIETRGEKEALAIMYAVRAKAKFLKAAGNPTVEQEEWKDAINDCKAFLYRYEATVSTGNPVKLFSHEKKILSQPSRAKNAPSFVGHMAEFQQGLESLMKSRERVQMGLKPKAASELCTAALQVLQPLDATAFKGIERLRAHLHLVRAQSYLELKQWDTALKDADKCYELDPRMKEAKILRDHARQREW